MMYFNEKRFRAKVLASPGCHSWTASVNGQGYGIFGVKEDGKFRCALAHRVAWQIAYGPFAKELCVLHKCDNPLCVNPDHLFLGTMADNMRDMAKKGRHVGMRGKRQPYDRKGNKITREIAEQIRESIGSQRSISAVFGVDQSLVSLIKSGKIWATDAPKR